MAQIDGGGGDRLAPVIPLFGGSGGQTERPARRADPPVRRSEPPLRPGRIDATPVGREEWATPGVTSPSGVAESRVDDASDWALSEAEAEARADAEKVLLRRLRTRQLSVAEARAVAREAGVDPAGIDEMLDAFVRRGYLDDAALADSLVYSAVERKGQGRGAIAPLLTKRGIPRDVADAALATLPDDEAERALEFARAKARSLGSRDRETALRRLTGQLARRGYPSSISLSAARQALDETMGGARGVRFD